jgi:hypothetical protein
MTPGTDWSPSEVEAAVADYLNMFGKELRREPFNKAKHNRQLHDLIPARTRGSIEWKHQNISAVLHELGYPCIEGYKPRWNFQRSLLPEVVERQLRESSELRSLIEAVVTAPARAAVPPSDLLSMFVPPPKPDQDERDFRFQETPSKTTRAQKNYLEIEARNHSLGRAGEELVMQLEHQRLWVAGKRKLADQIDHVAASRGDGLGYDIHSFETDGRDRLIEVKTTRFGPRTPFFASRNEVNVSEVQRDTFQLYRLFKFTERPRLFVLPGSLKQTCRLNAELFSAVVA